MNFVKVKNYNTNGGFKNNFYINFNKKDKNIIQGLINKRNNRQKKSLQTVKQIGKLNNPKLMISEIMNNKEIWENLNQKKTQSKNNQTTKIYV